MRARFSNLAWSFTLILMSCGLWGCDQVSDIRELARVSSPGKQLDVVITEINSDATVSKPYEVYLVGAGKKPTAAGLILKVDKTQQPHVEWVSNTTVVLRCEQARVWAFRNFASIADSGGGFANISVALECGQHGYGS